MLYILKAVELVVVLIFVLALIGAGYKFRDGFGAATNLDRIELSIVSLLSVSTLVHIINLFR